MAHIATMSGKATPRANRPGPGEIGEIGPPMALMPSVTAASQKAAIATTMPEGILTPVIALLRFGNVTACSMTIKARATLDRRQISDSGSVNRDSSGGRSDPVTTMKLILMKFLAAKSSNFV